MCMMVKDVNDIKIADKDIVCYKVVQQLSNGKIVTPYMGYEVDKESVMTDIANVGKADEFIPEVLYKHGPMLPFRFFYYYSRIKWMREKWYHKKYPYVLGGGGFHTYRHYLPALKFMKIRNMHTNGGFKVAKCIIPKGTKYLSGVTDGLVDESRPNKTYISKKLKVEKIYNL